MDHSGLGEYSSAFRENQIVGHNLLKMKEHDYKDLGVNAYGHLIKFREAITKLMKINERQKRNRQLRRQLNIQPPRRETKPTQNIIRWDSTVIDELDGNSLDGSSDVPSIEGSNDSRKSTTKTDSSSTSERKRLGSIDISARNMPKRKCSDNPVERKKSSESVLSLDNVDSRKELKTSSKHIQLSTSQLTPSSKVVYDISRPKIRRTMSMVPDNENEDATASISFEPEFNVPEKKSSSNKYPYFTQKFNFVFEIG